MTLRIFNTPSIRRKIKLSYIVIIMLMLVPSLMSITSSLTQTIKYDHLITNVSKVNRLNQIVKTDISNEIWDIFSGSKKFEDGRQYRIIDSINAGLRDVMKTTTVKGNRQRLEVAGRAMKTLSKYVMKLGVQMENHAPVSEDEKIVEDIRGVSALVSDILQEFIVLEIESAARENERIKMTVWLLACLETCIVVFVTSFAVFAQRTVSENIERPIRELERLSTRIASGNLTMRAELPHVTELDNLTENLNIMAVKIQELIDANILEQQNLQKSEMKALQAQITPHFIYNTMDTIIWLAEGNRNDQVIDVTRAFSSFFRISLSRGKDWVTVGEEIEHVRSYLTIQKIRYRDILDYTVECDGAITGKRVLKLILQPIVENALYHGIKNKRGRGRLTVKGWQEDGFLCFSVEDDGIGILQDRLADIVSQMNSSSDPESRGDVYGLYNVNKRLKLYYNQDCALEMKSVFREGTTVSFRVPEVVTDV
jgi:two-component system sensor histidine kinase YesM